MCDNQSHSLVVGDKKTTSLVEILHRILQFMIRLVAIKAISCPESSRFMVSEQLPGETLWYWNLYHRNPAVTSS